MCTSIRYSKSIDKPLNRISGYKTRHRLLGLVRLLVAEETPEDAALLFLPSSSPNMDDRLKRIVRCILQAAQKDTPLKVSAANGILKVRNASLLLLQVL